ncbi:Flagellar motor rotation protein MotB [Labilithrix luteola]|uniref:Flagellar motor rotation protein MotB n=1 Tax=Labilithrix luteola TaxID=1391654 RepID=A0A0K1Q594_9BACT|nr:OmpA family protein [Labilithrix luteola]AKV00822.1 Flagellar motor rotation protein MotB [Labilithrix luteola]
MSLASPHVTLGPVFAALGTMAAAGAVMCSVIALGPRDAIAEVPLAPPPTLANASLPLPMPSGTDRVIPPCLRREVNFALSSTTIDPESQGHIVELAEWLGEHPNAEVTVEGHADTRGPVDVNLWVSHERATAVAAILARHGVAKDKMQVRAFGSYRPLDGAPETDGRQRRVDLQVSDVTCARSP